MSYSRSLCSTPCRRGRSSAYAASRRGWGGPRARSAPGPALARNPAWVVGGLGRAAFPSRTAFTSRPAVATLAAGNLGVHESREERLFGGRDDRDLSAPAAGSSAAPVAPRAA